MDTLLTAVLTLLLGSVTVLPYYRRTRRAETRARLRQKELESTGLHLASTMHPHFDALACIGCGSCTRACPEGEVLAVVYGRATLVHGAKCVGHGVCVDACPVGAIKLVMAAPGRSANLPVLDDYGETTLSNVFIAGELGGIGLIKNAITQGIGVVDRIASRPRAPQGVLDLLIVGAGPAGLAAALNAKHHGLRAIILEQNDIGGTILQYPRQKIVMTSPVTIPLWGKLRLTETTKETLLEIWKKILETVRLEIRTEEKVLNIRPQEGHYSVTSSKGEYQTLNILLALGRRGTPRKLGVPGEALPKVAYRLIDAQSYNESHILVVGGGDSAVEAAIALSRQKANKVTLSYRGTEFKRIKARNLERLQHAVTSKKVMLALQSNVRQIRERSVLLDTPRGEVELTNQYVFVLAGGELPFDFLQRIGIRFQTQLVVDPPQAAR